MRSLEPNATVRDDAVVVLVDRARPAALDTHAVAVGHAAELHCREHEGALSLKLVRRGEASWRTSHVGYRVTDESYLMLNAREPYVLDITSPRTVETFCVYFRAGFVERAYHERRAGSVHLLDRDDLVSGHDVTFAGGLRAVDDRIGRSLHALHRLLREGPMGDDALLDRLHGLAERVVDAQLESEQLLARIPGIRASTRAELARRLHRARDMAESSLGERVTLDDMARAACLSPHHFHRMFSRAFGETPHGYLVRRRLDRARALLTRTDLPVGEVCNAVGFASLGSFSTLFRRTVGVSPRAYRQQTGIAKAQD